MQAPAAEAEPEAEFRASIIATHNKLRQLHGVPPLEWSDACAKDAQTAVDNCAAKGEMYNNTYDDQGQNVRSALYPLALRNS